MAAACGLRVNYRDATVDDAPALAELFRESFCETFGHLYRPEDLSAFLAGAKSIGASSLPIERSRSALPKRMARSPATPNWAPFACR
jgi:hypothetical protein